MKDRIAEENEGFTHLDPEGRARLVDVSGKAETFRVAAARGEVRMSPGTFARVRAGSLAKGDVLAVAQVAAIQGAKKTADIIPLCHPLRLSGIDVSFRLNEAESTVEIRAEARATGPTGVEMEALTAVTAAALTIYDMCKAAEKGIVIAEIALVSKDGGKSGAYRNPAFVEDRVSQKTGVAPAAKILAVNGSDSKGVTKTPLEKGYFQTNHGLRGDAHAADWHRQVSFLGWESVEKIQARGLPDLGCGVFAENLTTEGIVLYDLPVGTKLCAGEALFEITQIGKECHADCAIRQQIGDCVMPREGVFARVLESGWVKPGDALTVRR